MTNKKITTNPARLLEDITSNGSKNHRVEKSLARLTGPEQKVVIAAMMVKFGEGNMKALSEVELFAYGRILTAFIRGLKAATLEVLRSPTFIAADCVLRRMENLIFQQRCDRDSGAPKNPDSISARAELLVAIVEAKLLGLNQLLLSLGNAYDNQGRIAEILHQINVLEHQLKTYLEPLLDFYTGNFRNEGCAISTAVQDLLGRQELSLLVFNYICKNRNDSDPMVKLMSLPSPKGKIAFPIVNIANAHVILLAGLSQENEGVRQLATRILVWLFPLLSDYGRTAISTALILPRDCNATGIPVRNRLYYLRQTELNDLIE